MKELSPDELNGFSSVASGLRQRARWRTPHGWVKAQRTTDSTLTLAGPADELRRIWNAHRAEWSCPRSKPGVPPQQYTGHHGAAEMILVRHRPGDNGRGGSMQA